MMLVVAIIVVLGGIAIVSYSSYSDHATDTRIGEDIKVIDSAIAAYSLKMGEPPANIKLLCTPDAFGNIFIAEKHLYDPWAREYSYDPMGTRNASAGSPKTPDVWCEKDNWVVGNFTNHKKQP